MRKLAAASCTAITAATALVLTVPAAQAEPAEQVHAVGAPHAWGPLYTLGTKRAKAQGSVTPFGVDNEVIPSAATLKVSGRVYDLTHGRGTCGWAVFEIAVVTPSGNNVQWKNHSVRTCLYGKPKQFTFTYHDVFELGIKVCSEADASEPPIQCTAGNPAWKPLYQAARH